MRAQAPFAKQHPRDLHPRHTTHALMSRPRQHWKLSVGGSWGHTRIVVPIHMDRPMIPSMRSAFQGPDGSGALLALVAAASAAAPPGRPDIMGMRAGVVRLRGGAEGER